MKDELHLRGNELNNEHIKKCRTSPPNLEYKIL